MKQNRELKMKNLETLGLDPQEIELLMSPLKSYQSDSTHLAGHKAYDKMVKLKRQENLEYQSAQTKPEFSTPAMITHNSRKMEGK